MSNVTDPDLLQPFTRTCQIIHGAMVMGVVTFLILVLFVVPDLTGPPRGPAGVAAGPTTPLLTYIAAGLGALGLAMSFVVPGLFVNSVRRLAARGAWPADATGQTHAPGKNPQADAPRRLLPLYQTQHITGAAILEGTTFFATIAYMMERNPIALGTAIVLLGTLIARFPTADRINAWLERQLEQLRDDYETGSSD
jgi:hypothetical protein